MANAARNANRRADNYHTRTYVDGNTVRRALVQEPARKQPVQQPRPGKVSKNAQKNRKRAMVMNRGFVVFLTLVCVAVLFTGVRFLQMKAEVTAKSKIVANLESELSERKADNDAYYSQVIASADLDAIKKRAISKLGMKYPTEEQTVTYETLRSSYVRQYQDVPDTK